MQKFPKWLPQNVVAHCQAKLDSGALSEDQKNCILRLTTQDDMRFAWQALLRVSDNTDKLVDLIEYLRLHPTVMVTEPKTHKLTAANQRRVLKEVSVLSELLLSTLSKLNPIEADAHYGIHLIQSEIHRLQNHSAQMQDGDSVVHLFQLFELLEAVDQDYGIARTLQSLQEASKLAMEAPPDGPRKQGAKTASRTVFIKDLKCYIQFNFGKQLNQVVATVVNTAMNLPPETVTEDMVRKA
jgi:hypothetical protein